MMLAACKKENQLGFEVFPKDDEVILDSLVIYPKTYSFREANVQTNGLSKQMLGSYNDVVFGTTTASIATEFIYTTPPNLDTANIDIVSFTLKFAYVKDIDDVSASYFYGNRLEPLRLHVYRLTDTLQTTGVYYSNIFPNHEKEDIVLDSLVNISMSDSTFKIKLKPEHAKRYLKVPEEFDSIQWAYANYVKGFYIKASTYPSSIISLNFNSLDTYFSIIYTKKGETTQNEFQLAFDQKHTQHYNILEHNYTGKTPLNTITTTNNISDSLVYLQSLLGFSAKIEIPNNNPVFSQKIAIYRAELEMKCSQREIDLYLYKPIPAFRIFKIDINDLYYKIPDYITAAGDYASFYDNETKSYKFNITQYLQDELDSLSNRKMLVIRSDRFVTEANRVILKGSNHTDPPQIKIYYTRLKI